MNPPPDTGPSSADMGAPHVHVAPANWREALMDLIASRADLIQLESKVAFKYWLRSAVMIGAAVVSVFFAWALVVAGVVSLISASANWSWYWVAIGVGILHLVVGFILVKLSRPSDFTPFPFTRAEFKKDRQWIENFHKPKKSSD